MKKITFWKRRRIQIWGEGEGRLYIFPKSGCQDSSLVQDVAKKQYELKSPGMNIELLYDAGAATKRKSFRSNQFRRRLTFIACSQTKYMEVPKKH